MSIRSAANFIKAYENLLFICAKEKTSSPAQTKFTRFFSFYYEIYKFDVSTYTYSFVWRISLNENRIEMLRVYDWVQNKTSLFSEVFDKSAPPMVCS